MTSSSLNAGDWRHIIVCMSVDRTAHVAMEWTPEGGNRKTGSETETRRETFNEDLMVMEITRNEANTIIRTDCIRWRKLVGGCSERNIRK